MTIRPLSDRVVLKMVEAEETTAAGIILAAKSKEKPQIAEVISVGPGGVVERRTHSGICLAASAVSLGHLTASLTWGLDFLLGNTPHKEMNLFLTPAMSMTHALSSLSVHDLNLNPFLSNSIRKGCILDLC